MGSKLSEHLPKVSITQQEYSNAKLVIDGVDLSKGLVSYSIEGAVGKIPTVKLELLASLDECDGTLEVEYK